MKKKKKRILNQITLYNTVKYRKCLNNNNKKKRDLPFKLWINRNPLKYCREFKFDFPIYASNALALKSFVIIRIKLHSVETPNLTFVRKFKHRQY